jgi:hypothetical protein
MLAWPDRGSGFLDGGVKKWFMLQMWRIQQVAQVITIALLAFNLALLLQDKMNWREGTVFADTYAGVLVILFVLVAAIWIFAIAWDIRFKMWREQQTVLIERNPYAKEKMAAKEIVVYELFWLPVMERLGKEDPEIGKAAESFRAWVGRLSKDDPRLARDIGDVYKYMGKERR